MADLFADAAALRAAERAPLPQRLRPRSLAELAGQTHVLGEGSALRAAIEEARPPSMILHGPPGVGKTTIARIVADISQQAFEEISAVSARVDDVRAVIQRARDRLGGHGSATILFIDEIHRFDKRQQDSVLHAVEEGLITLIGATTENPYFQVNQALLSRCMVIELHPLDESELRAVLARGAASLGADVPEEALAELVTREGETRGRLSRRSSSPGRPHPEGRSPPRMSPTSPESAPSATTGRVIGTTTSRRR